MLSNRFLPTSLAVGLSVFATNALAQTAEGYSHHGDMMGYGGWGHMIVGPILMLLFIALATVVVILVVRAMSRGRCGHRRSSSAARTILEERFAKGEIDKAEFEDRKTTLGVTPHR